MQRNTKEENTPMLAINIDDVINVINSIKAYLIGFGVVAVLLILAMILCGKLSKSKKYLVRFNSALGLVLALGIRQPDFDRPDELHGYVGYRRRQSQRRKCCSFH